MLVFAVKVAVMYFLALVMIRILGKRALGELGPFDFVVMTGVGDTVISVALDKRIPFYDGIIVLATLAVLEYLIGYLSLKSEKLSNIITGVPVVLIDNGKIIKKNLAREKFNADDLLQELRKKGVRDINEVEKGILESCGGFSVILKPDEEAVKRKDLGICAGGQDEFLTTGQISRQEFFRERPESEIIDNGFCLADSLKDIQYKIDLLFRRLEAMEQQLETKNIDGE
jgi:uncharacterized membrane protein YcaP (DUF421 family)